VERLRVCRRLTADIRFRGRAQAALVPAFEAARRLGPWPNRALAAHAHDASHAAAAVTAFKWRGHTTAWHGRRLLRLVALPALHRPGSASFALVRAPDAFTLTTVCHLRPGEARRLADAITEELETLAHGTG
jgi:hypothetical protein